MFDRTLKEPLGVTNSKTTHLLSSLFRLNILKGTAKAPAVDLLRLNALRGTKPLFKPLKGTKSTPSIFYGSFPPPPGRDRDLRPKCARGNIARRVQLRLICLKSSIERTHSSSSLILGSPLPLADGPSDEKVFANDQILKVNGQDVRDAAQADVISLIKYVYFTYLP